MCSCDLTKLANGVSMNDLIQDKSLREILSEYKMIDKTAFRNGQPLAILNYASCVNFSKLKAVFDNLGINFEVGDIPDMAKIIDAGGDRSGMLLNRANQPVYFDAMQEVKKIRFTNEEVNNSSCSIAWR